MIKVIVIDDQPLEGRMVSFLLERDCPFASYAGQALSAADGIELTRKAHPDIAFLDITMPGMDGIEAIAALREAQPNIRIVMLTAHDDFQYIQRAMRAGANDYLLKPSHPQDILDAVNRWSRREGADEDTITAAKRYIEDNLDKNITLPAVAERLYLSPAYFSRIFSARTGQTFSSWLAKRRIERAKRYLEETDLSVAEIASRVGYRESNSFTRVFKMITTLPPTEYRKKCRTK